MSTRVEYASIVECVGCIAYRVLHYTPIYHFFHTIPATFRRQIHKYHTDQSYKPHSLHHYALLKNEAVYNFTSLATIAKKYAFLYQPNAENLITLYAKKYLLVFNVWMIHKIEIFPHYTYPLPDGAAKLKAKTNNMEHSPEQTEQTSVFEGTKHNKCAADENFHYNHKNSTTNTLSLASSTPSHTSSVQPYRTCSHYGFNYPITYQPHITIHPAHLLTAVQLQREKVIAFIKSTALSLNTGYLQQQQCEFYSIRQPRAPRLKSFEALCSTDKVSKEPTAQHTTPHSDSTNNNNDSNSSYISVKEIKLEPTKRRRRISKVSTEHGCENESVAVGVQQLSGHDRDLQTPELSTHSLSEQFSSLLSIGGTSYPAGSHSHTAELVHYHDGEGVEEEHHHNVDDVGYENLADNYSAVFAPPTTQRATYLLRDFLPAHAQTHEMPEHKPESEQELHCVDVTLATSTPKVRKLLNYCDDEERSDETHLYAHHSHKQIKLTLNSNAQSAALKRHSAHTTQEIADAAVISVGLPHERYRHVNAPLSEAGSSSTPTSSLRSLEIHININVKNSDCARTLQTHETEFRRKLERIINEEINVITQQLSGGSTQQQHSNDSHHLHLEHSDSARHLLQHNAHLETLSDLRLAGKIAVGQQYKHGKASKSQTQTHTHRNASYHHSTTCYDDGNTTKANPPLTAQQRVVIATLEQELESLLNGIICANALHNHAVMCDCKMKVAQISQELRTSLSVGK